MRRLQTFFFLIALCLWTKAAIAHQPMESRPFKERVELAQYIFVGTFEDVIPVDKDLHVIPDDKLGEIHDMYLFQIRVEESLTPKAWAPTKPVLAFASGAYSNPKELRKSRIGERYVFLTKMILVPDWGPILIPSYGYFLTTSLEDKLETTKLAKPNPDGARQWEHYEWLAQCLKEINTIQPGASRESVGKLLYESNDRAGKYVLRSFPFITIQIEFALPNKNQPADKVTQVSNPSLEWAKSE